MNLAAPRPLRSKIKSPATLARILARSRRQKKTSVFTNGCFDLIHRGHVTMLGQARKLGSYLVVALNSDASVRRLGKGPDRPINPLGDRLEVMAALESVDFVTWFDEDTPLELIKILRPDILVKGGDWKTKAIVGGPEVLSWGGKVKSLPYLKGKSTTEILRRAASKSK